MKILRKLFGNKNKIMNDKVKIIGVYEVDSSEPCHLIELIIKNSQNQFDITEFTQKIPKQPKSNWQVPYEDKFLNDEGTTIIGDSMGYGGQRGRADDDRNTGLEYE